MKQLHISSIVFAIVIVLLYAGIGSCIVDKAGVVDDCCCEVDKVITSNAKDINPILNELVKKRFFQYFKLDLFTQCPFWASSFLCGVGGCAVCECNDDEVPMFWKKQKTDRVSVYTPDNFVSWKDTPENMWNVEGSEQEMSYVNLAQHPESFTGYNDGKIVWESIYNENCFKGSLDSMCLEERVFFRLISGLHTSITTHICRYYHHDIRSDTWLPNVAFYRQNVAPYPERIKNLHFAYLFLLRAANKLAPVLENYTFETGNATEALETQQLMKTLLHTNLLCSPNFDETMLFNSSEKETLRQQFNSHFRNISLIMNCVTCEKCKVYAKLQVLGIGTALKVLFEPNQAIKQLQRNEIIALINTLRQFSNSIEAIEYFENPNTCNTLDTSLVTSTTFQTLMASIIVMGASYLFYSFKYKTKNSKSKHFSPEKKKPKKAEW